MSVLNNNEPDNTLNQDQTSSKIKQKEWGGQKGPEPTRYGDWEKNGRVSDF
jgi:hypothetical protein